MNLKQQTALSLIFVTVIAGCGSGPSPIAADTDSVKRATTMRSLYTKSGGDYNTLSADEKAQFKAAISPSITVEKAWANLAPQKVNMNGGGDPRSGG